MQFQDAETVAPDAIAECMLLLVAAYPRYRLAPPTAALYRQKLQRVPEETLRIVVNGWIEKNKTFPELSALLTECRMHGLSSGETASYMDPSEERFEKMTRRERWMFAHAKWLLIAADCQRRLTNFNHASCLHSQLGLGPCTCENRIDHLNTELLAHGIRITSDGSRVHYDIDLILNPNGCPR